MPQATDCPRRQRSTPTLGSGRPRGDSQAISTVVDITLALLIVSASVVLLGMFLATDDAESTPEEADRSAETISAMTMTTRYDISAVTAHSEFDEGKVGDGAALEREVHGPLAGLLGEAAVTGVAFRDSERWNDTGRRSVVADAFEDEVGEGLYARMANTGTRVYVMATWEPYRNSSIRGEATAGDLPPPDADVHSVTMTVPTRFDDIDESTIGDYDDLAEALARSIVGGYFPEERTQLALEQRGTERQLTLYRYKQFEAAVNSTATMGERTDPGSPLNRTVANATAANQELIDALAPRIEAELTERFDTVDDAVEGVRISTVSVTVQTWNE